MNPLNAFLLADTGTDALGQLTQVTTQSGNAFVQIYHDTVSQFVATAPKVIAAVIVLVVGYVVARLAAKIIKTVGDKIGLQTAAERGGLAESMRQVGIGRTLPDILGMVVFWTLILVFLGSAFQVLNLPYFTVAMTAVVGYVPKVLGALVVLFIGFLVATFLRGVVATSADRIGVAHAQYLANGCYYLLLLMTFMAAFNQLELRFELLNYVILIAFAGVAVAFGVAVGLGGRDVVAGILAGYYLRQRMQSGDFVTIGTLEGTVREVGPVATVVETVEGGLMNRRSVPNILMLNEAVR